MDEQKKKRNDRFVVVPDSVQYKVLRFFAASDCWVLPGTRHTCSDRQVVFCTNRPPHRSFFVYYLSVYGKHGVALFRAGVHCIVLHADRCVLMFCIKVPLLQ